MRRVISLLTLICFLSNLAVFGSEKVENGRNPGTRATSALLLKVGCLYERLARLEAAHLNEMSRVLGDSLSRLHHDECVEFDSSVRMLKAEIASLLAELEAVLEVEASSHSLGLASTALSEVSPPNDSSGTLSGIGDLLNLGKNERLKGLALAATYTSEFMSNLSGGLRRGTGTLDNFDLTVSVDAEELLGWKGASLFLYGLGNHGGSPSEHAGDLQTASNIDAPNAWKLYEAWLEQRWFGEKLSLRAGLYDLNSEFDALQTAGLFLNSSHGIGPEISQTGRNGPSIFPTTSLGVRAKTQVAGACYAQMVVLDGV